MILEWPKQVSKNRVDCKITNLKYQNSLIRNVKNDIMHYLNDGKYIVERKECIK